MAGGDAVEHVGFQHGIEALARERDAVVREHVGVVFQMMSEFWPVSVLEHRLECREHLFTIELLRSSRIVVAERHVCRFPRRDRERQADDARLHVIEAVGFRIEGNERCRGEPRQPRI